MARVLNQMAGLTGTAPTAAAPAPAATVAVPSVPPSSGNQVTLNQFFGRTKFPDPASANQPRRLSLFQHKQKERRKVQTLALSAADADAATIAALKNPTAAGTTSPAPVFTPEKKAN
jgi:hypothetical protein